ncbi:hypothetical protein BUALT_Bualt03G0122900 [Buddleja alternifolia]|uniref:PB1-like domain-containing protein n=1 Tax=Buddleja alternifolia TaxID=168488 RepID=A0AAV6XZU7_9LAMI|nr:hypothetical protein BUALT_Bualt03G0122900 [Buddleja alternifolia]
MSLSPVRFYSGGSVDYFDNVDGEMFGLIELKGFVGELGYDKERVKFWHQYGHNLHMGSKELKGDSEVYGMLPPPLPLVYENRPGRPPKLRKRGSDEPPAPYATKLKKIQKPTKCKKCVGEGHNQRTCGKRKRTNSVSPTNPNESANNPSAPAVASSTPQSSQNVTPTPSRPGKLPVRKPPKSKKIANTNVDFEIGETSNTVSSINVTQSSSVRTSVIVRGGMNFISVPNLRATIGSQNRMGAPKKTGGKGGSHKVDHSGHWKP